MGPFEKCKSFNAMIYKCHKAVFYSQLSIEIYQMVEPKKEVFDHF